MAQADIRVGGLFSDPALAGRSSLSALATVGRRLVFRPRVSWEELAVGISDVPCMTAVLGAHAEYDEKKNYVAMIKTFKLLWEHQNEALDTYTWLSDRLETHRRSEREKTEDHFTTAPSQLSTIDLDWVAMWLKRRLQLTDRQLGKMRARGAEDIRLLLCAYLAASPYLRMGHQCKNRQILDRALTGRENHCGTRMETLKTGSNAVFTGVNTEGIIDWGMVGPWELIEEDDNIVEILHRPTDDKVDVREFGMTTG